MTPAIVPANQTSSEVKSVFVYGTLKRGECREHCWPVAPHDVRPAVVQGALFDLGPYPAMCEGTEWILGEIWRLPAGAMEPTLRALDAIEGYVPGGGSNIYERITVEAMPVDAANGTESESAFAYIMKEDCLPACATKIRPIASDTWLSQPVAYWPINGASPEITSKLPDPFPTL